MKTLLLTIILSLFGLKANAYPELIRHGYTNCTACHVSPAGGGLLTEYGRNLSREILSTWGTESEAQVFHGAVNTESVNKWLLVGGDIRAIQVHKDNTIERTGKFIRMQAGVELGLVKDQWSLVSFIGKYDRNENWTGDSSRYYLMWKPQDEASVRAGRFLPQFGLNIPEHVASTRGPLGFGYGMERDALEAQWTGEFWNANITTSSSPVNFGTSAENANSAQLQYAYNDKSKIGLSLWKGKASSFDRTLTGVHGLFGFTPQLYLLSEADILQQLTSQASTRGFYTYHKLGYEFHQGISGLLVADYMQTNTDDGRTIDFKYGIGFQWFPRPHFELNGLWSKERNKSISDSEGDYAWLLLHYYI